MKLIYVASPYAGELEKNVAFAKISCDFVLKQGHGFFAPHLCYPKILDDNDPLQRKVGLEMALTMLTCVTNLVIQILGEEISQGMKMEIEFAKEKEIPVHNISSADVKKAVKSVVKSMVTGEKASQEMAVC